MFGKKRRQIDALTTEVWSLQSEKATWTAANEQVAGEYQKLLDEQIKLRQAWDERGSQIRSLKEEARTRECQMAAMRKVRDADSLRIEALKDAEAQVNVLLSERVGLEDLLREAQDALSRMVIDRDETHAELVDANRLLDATNEWIGEFAKRCLISGRVSRSELEAIRDGWTTPDGRYPWEE